MKTNLTGGDTKFRDSRGVGDSRSSGKRRRTFERTERGREEVRKDHDLRYERTGQEANRGHTKESS